jgi:hypothetical protein
LCFNNRLNFYYRHKFPMKHLLYLNKLWTFYHFMSIQTTDVACIWRCLLWFWFGCVAFVVSTLVSCFFFLHVSTLWFVIP